MISSSRSLLTFDLHTRSHLDAQIFSNQRKQCRGKTDPSFFVNRHVHPGKLLVGKSIRTFVPKTKRWCHVFQHVEHFGKMKLPAEVEKRSSAIERSVHSGN